MDKVSAAPAIAVDKGRAIFRVVINGSEQAIFDDLTSVDRPLGAIFNSCMATTGLRRGGRIQMRTVSGRHTIVDGEILEYDPPHRFVHTHRFTQFDDPASIVTYELKPVAGGIEVTLTVDDLPRATRTAAEMAKGGDFMLKNLKAIIETGRPTFGARMMYVMFDAMEFVLPARTKSELWPIDRKASK